MTSRGLRVVVIDQMLIIKRNIGVRPLNLRFGDCSMAFLAERPWVNFSAVASLAIGLSISPPLLAGSVSDGPAPSSQKGVNLANGPKAPATDEPIARWQMASDLLAFGRDIKDPLVLIIAARITKALGGTEVDLKPDGRGAAASAQKSGQPVSADSILVEAHDLAKGEKITNLLIDETAAMGTAAGAGQPKTHQDTAQPAATEVYSIEISGG